MRRRLDLEVPSVGEVGPAELVVVWIVEGVVAVAAVNYCFEFAEAVDDVSQGLAIVGVVGGDYNAVGAVLEIPGYSIRMSCTKLSLK